MSIHFVSTPQIAIASTEKIVLVSRLRRVFNPVFVTGIILFVASMLLKANRSEAAAAIPLALSSLILLYGVWLLSAQGMVIISREEKKVIRIYKHLGYLQKIFITPLQSVDGIEIQGNEVSLLLDNLKRICIVREKNSNQQQLEKIKSAVNSLLNTEKIA